MACNVNQIYQEHGMHRSEVEAALGMYIGIEYMIPTYRISSAERNRVIKKKNLSHRTHHQ